MRRTRDGGYSFGPIRAHSGVFREMQALVQLAQLRDENPKAYDRVMEEQIGGRKRRLDQSRRRFLKGAAGAAGAALGLEVLESFYKSAHGQVPRSAQVYNVAIVGAGIAGLNCAWQLRKMGPALAQDGIILRVTIYEGRERTGGRMLTSIGDVARNMHCELGAEFIDSSNHDMFRLVQDPELGRICQDAFGHPLAMLDTGSDPGDSAARPLIGQHLVIREGNQEIHRTIEQASAEMSKFVRMSMQQLKVLNDKCKRFLEQRTDTCGGTENFGHNNAGFPSGIQKDPALVGIDQMNVREYLTTGKQGSGITPLGLPRDHWVTKYMETAYVTEYGVPLEKQSAMSLVSLFGNQDENLAQVDVFGPSDERFKVFGGNDKVVRCLSIGLRDQIRLNHKLTAITQNGGKYVLSFDRQQAQAADLVVLACPSTMLSTTPLASLRGNLASHPRYRRMDRNQPDYQPEFTPPADISAVIASGSPKANAIDRVGYGRNFKLMAGLDQQIWRNQANGRWGGYTFSDRPFQMGWDSGQCQDLADVPVARMAEGRDPAFVGMIKNQIVRGGRATSTASEGFQFSWFRGGNADSERIIAETSRYGVVSHTMDDGASSSAQHAADARGMRNAYLGVRGSGKSRYATNVAAWNQAQGIMKQVMDRVIADTDGVYTGFQESNARQSARLGRAATSSYIWNNDPFTRASYLAYDVGQWTSISGLEGAPVGFDGRLANFDDAGRWSLFFAGEHCSGEFQGFMNGGAQTGRLAAVRMLLALKKRHSTSRFAVPAHEMSRLLVPSRRDFFVSGLDRIFG
jgi:monoamine oxidase